MAAARRHCGSGACSGSCVGMAYEHDGYEVVCGIFPGKSSSLPGLLRDSPDIDGTDSVRAEEVGLLDSMAFRERGQPDSLPEGRTGLHAGSQLPVLGKRHLVPVHMV